MGSAKYERRVGRSISLDGGQGEDVKQTSFPPPTLGRGDSNTSYPKQEPLILQQAENPEQMVHFAQRSIEIGPVVCQKAIVVGIEHDPRIDSLRPVEFV